MNHKKNLLTVVRAGFTGKIAFSLFLFVLSFVWSSCGGDSTDPANGNWRQVESGFRGEARYSAASFTIDSVVYVGLGIDRDADRLNDFFSYDPSAGYWNTVATFPGIARSGAVGFSVGGFGFVGLGYNNDTEDDYLKDFYKYDPQTNTWTKLKDFEGEARHYAVSFVIGDKAYVGTGINDNYLQDFWVYDYKTDDWTPVRDFGGTKRYGAVAFTVNGKGYVGFGNNNGSLQKNIYEYDPAANTWTRKSQLGDEDDVEGRNYSSAFVINNRAYIFGGLNGSSQLGDLWEYEPTGDTWTERESLNTDCGTARSYVIAFSHNNTGYIVTGANATSSGNALDDMWTYTPSVVQVDCADE